MAYMMLIARITSVDRSGSVGADRSHAREHAVERARDAREVERAEEAPELRVNAAGALERKRPRRRASASTAS
jgi:hypothetical protein